MKKTLIYLFFIITITACEQNSPAQETDKLIGTWSYGNTGYLKRDAEFLTDNYPGLSIEFGEGTIDVTGGGDLFPQASDTWTYANESKTSIIRGSDDLEMEVETSGDIVYLRFVYTTTTLGGRVDEVTGDYEIKLEKQ